MYWDMWWLKEYASRKGNIYPTHGLGPICQIMDINRGDKFEFLVSVESKDFMMGAKANPGFHCRSMEIQRKKYGCRT